MGMRISRGSSNSRKGASCALPGISDVALLDVASSSEEQAAAVMLSGPPPADTENFDIFSRRGAANMVAQAAQAEAAERPAPPATVPPTSDPQQDQDRDQDMALAPAADSGPSDGRARVNALALPRVEHRGEVPKHSPELDEAIWQQALDMEGDWAELAPPLSAPPPRTPKASATRTAPTTPQRLPGPDSTEQIWRSLPHLAGSRHLGEFDPDLSRLRPDLDPGTEGCWRRPMPRKSGVPRPSRISKPRAGPTAADSGAKTWGSGSPGVYPGGGSSSGSLQNADDGDRP